MYGTILRVWFPGCPLLRGNFVLKCAIGSLDLVCCPESRSVHFSEGPLSEVRLQYTSFLGYYTNALPSKG